MLSKRLKKLIDEIDKNDPNARNRREIQGIFIDIARTLAQMREHRGLSQRQLAQRLQTSHPTIVRWETAGYTGYKISKLLEIASTLNYRLQIIFTPKEISVTSTTVVFTRTPQWNAKATGLLR